jgi:hypothetical protein
MKKYKIVPYVANITTKQTSQAVAESVEKIINDFATQGWIFDSIEKIETNISDPGCFGKKTAINFIQLIIFCKNEE